MDDPCPFDGELPAPRAPKPPAQPQTAIQRIANAPMESLSFKDFMTLRSGRDQFSNMKLPQLHSAIADLDAPRLTAEFPDDLAAQAVCLRWMLRGLPLDKAIRKVKTDAELAAKARSRRT